MEEIVRNATYSVSDMSYLLNLNCNIWDLTEDALDAIESAYGELTEFDYRDFMRYWRDLDVDQVNDILYKYHDRIFDEDGTTKMRPSWWPDYNTQSYSVSEICEILNLNSEVVVRLEPDAFDAVCELYKRWTVVVDGVRWWRQDITRREYGSDIDAFASRIWDESGFPRIFVKEI